MEWIAHRSDTLHQFAVGKNWRPPQHDRGNVGLVGGKAQNSVAGRIGVVGQRIGEGEADSRRGVVEKNRDAGLQVATHILADVAVEICVGHRGRRLSPTRRRSGSVPSKKLLGIHWLIQVSRSFT